MNWNQIATKVKPYIVRIKTPSRSGTGFLCLYNHDKSWCGIATALHVVEDADEWQQPIKIIHQASETPTVLLDKPSSRIVFPDPENDSAIIFFKKPENLNLPDELIQLRSLEKILDIGSEVGWLGYPYLEENMPCFFSGCISARNNKKKYYLIDGVVINGVSGGPVLFSTEAGDVQFIGIITAYMPNRATGSALPGLSIAQDVFYLHDTVRKIKTIDAAMKKKQELKEKGQSEGEKTKDSLKEAE